MYLDTTQFGSCSRMLPLPKIIFRSVEVFWKTIGHVYLHNICASFVKFHENPIFFLVYVKKRKFILWKQLFCTKFIFLHTSSIFYETILWAHSMWSMCEFFVLIFFEIENMCKLYSPMFQNTTPIHWNSIFDKSKKLLVQRREYTT
jgi:hypothetical protein